MWVCEAVAWISKFINLKYQARWVAILLAEKSAGWKATWWVSFFLFAIN